LANVVPVPSNEYPDGSNWSAAATGYFMQIAAQKIIEARVVGANPLDGMPLVELATHVDGARADVAHMLVDKQFATYRQSPSVSPPSDMDGRMISPSPSP